MKRVAFLGGGNMAEAIIGGLIAGGVIAAENIAVFDVSAERLDVLQRQFGIRAAASNAEAATGADVVVLAVKPQQAEVVLAEVAPALSNGQLLVSICAGLPTARLESLTPARVIRVMPNLPALVRCGVSAICSGIRSTAGDLDVVEAFFGSVGMVVRLPESQMNEVTALSGSGPGYVFAFMEALEAGAVEMGLSPEAARAMTVATVQGAAEMAVQTGDSPASLRERVSSKGGTTLAGLAAMEARGWTAAIRAGMKAVRDRAVELAT